MSEDLEFQKIVGQVAAAYFTGVKVAPDDIPKVIRHIAASLAAARGASAAEAPPERAPEPAARSQATPDQVRRSITHEALISFEDNRPYKTLRRHLAARGLSPEAYRTKWGLPADYPIVAPAYSETRSGLAKALGLGARRATAASGDDKPPADVARQPPAASRTDPRIRRRAAARARKLRSASGPAPAAES